MTTTLEPVFEELDRFGIPHAVSGGRLFFTDPLHQSFLLALRGLAGHRDADIDDGAALAALDGPRVFGLDLQTLVRGRTPRPETGEDPFAAERAELHRVQAIVDDLRRERSRRAPGETARLLLQRSQLGTTVALGPNGEQRLRRLYELSQIVEVRAKQRALDFDGVTRALRDALEAPPALDAPPPLGEHAVSVLTIHQSKGLEFPVVILWHCTAVDEPRVRRSPWTVDRDGEHWSIALDGLVHASDPGGTDDRDALAHELRRLFYVAATRARDRLVITVANPSRGMHKRLVPAGAGDTHDAQAVWPTHTIHGSEWSEGVQPPPRESVLDDADPYEAGRAAWIAARQAAARPIARRVPVSEWAHARVLANAPSAPSSGSTSTSSAIDPEAPPADAAALVAPGSDLADLSPPPPSTPYRRGRHGTDFGNTVHEAFESILRYGTPTDDAVQRRATANDLPNALHADARADVQRALDALRREGLLDRDDIELRPEYPVAGRGAPGEMLIGIIDLAAATPDALWIVDYKTDHPPTKPVAEELLQYVAQVRAYADLLTAAGLTQGRAVHRALLFTANGTLHRV